MSTPETALQQPAPAALEVQRPKLTALVATAKNHRITDTPTREMAATLRLELKGAEKRAKGYEDFHCRPLTEQVERIRDQVRPLKALVKEGVEAIDREVSRDFQEQRRLAAEARRKAEDEARAAMEAAEANAREERAAEARAAEERARQEAIAAGFKKREAEQLAQMEKADVEAKPLQIGPVAAPVYIPGPAKTTVASSGARMAVSEVWDFEITDPVALLRAMPEAFDLKRGTVLTEIRCQDRSGRLPQIPGVRAFKKPQPRG